MSVNPLDLLDESFPHGTIEGKRGGCVASDCPAKPMRCIEVARAYHTDRGFKQLYMSGLRGEELLGAWNTRLKQEQPVPERPAVAPVFVSSPEQARLDDLDGPQVRQAWVLLDADRNIVLAAAQPEVAVAALAEAWRAYLAPKAGVAALAEAWRDHLAPESA